MSEIGFCYIQNCTVAGEIDCSLLHYLRFEGLALAQPGNLDSDSCCKAVVDSGELFLTIHKVS